MYSYPHMTGKLRVCGIPHDELFVGCVGMQWRVLRGGFPHTKPTQLSFYDAYRCDLLLAGLGPVSSGLLPETATFRISRQREILIGFHAAFPISAIDSPPRDRRCVVYTRRRGDTIFVTRLKAGLAWVRSPRRRRRASGRNQKARMKELRRIWFFDEQRAETHPDTASLRIHALHAQHALHAPAPECCARPWRGSAFIETTHLFPGINDSAERRAPVHRNYQRGALTCSPQARSRQAPQRP
jgi:hypothetical protein